MVGDVGIISSISGVSSAPIVAVPAASNVTSPSFASTATAGLSVPTAPAALLHSPRTVEDPSAGFITQYLSANGSQVISQTPTAITVAYLRQGLTADGLTKPPAYQPVATTA